jgi:hypothetical protein
MANEHNNRGGTHEQHVKAGEQSHKNTSGSSKGEGRERPRAENETGGGSSRGGSPEKDLKAGEQSSKGKSDSSTQGGADEQHAKASEQTRKSR